MGLNWRDINNEREKYHAYLCSEEWGKLRFAVRQRSRGTCEKCQLRPMVHVHHQTYIRKYNEQLSDLLAVCDECHNRFHGHLNPARETVVAYANNPSQWKELLALDLSLAADPASRTRIIIRWVNKLERDRCKRNGVLFKPPGWEPEVNEDAKRRNMLRFAAAMRKRLEMK